MNFKNTLVKPVLFMVFNRPEKTKQVWEQIRKAKPQKLYISADGPRTGVEHDFEKCNEVRSIVEVVDWDCDVKRLYHNENLGCSQAGRLAFEWIFTSEDCMIQIEDDVLPTSSFFWFMQEMLDRYKDDDRIGFVCSENYGIKFGNATYFFTQYGTSGGWATWKRIFNLWEYKLDSLEEVINKPEFRKTFLTKFQYDYWKRLFYHWKHVGGNTYDLQNVFLVHKYNLVNIVPNINLNTNIGWDLDATNANLKSTDNPLALKWGNKPSYEIDSIDHPNEVITNPDVDLQWFKYHFMGSRSQLEFRLRWMLSSLKKRLIPKIYRIII